MLSNFHTHSIFCDGVDTPEEMANAALEQGFDALGFSSHGYTEFDLRYCMKDEDGYIERVNAVKEAYKGRLEIYLGTEEDAFDHVAREKYDYIIGSSHYLLTNKGILPIDSSAEHFAACLEAFKDNTLALAKSYYSAFCSYIRSRRPDIVGHFDLITKYDELAASRFLADPAYNAIAERYAALAAESGCVFEVNTGAIARSLRTAPYPAANLLSVLKKGGARFILSSDCHDKTKLAFAFDDAKAFLREAGIREAVTLSGGEFVSYTL